MRSSATPASTRTTAATRRRRGESSTAPDLRPIVVRAAGDPVAGDGWHVDIGECWIKLRHRASQMPEQGWKLHVSAATTTAEAVLRSALPVLLADTAPFKVASSIEVLAALNNGEGGLSQIGKFITVYPRDDRHAVRLAGALDQATDGLRGPAVPSDRAVRRGSIVSYRYGGFGPRTIQSPVGAVLPALQTPAGDLVVDHRTPRYRPPDWAVDPFGASHARDQLLIADRYLILSTIHRSARGMVHLGADLVQRRACIIKRALRDARLRADGRDARDFVRQEAHVLGRLKDAGRFPAVLDVVEHDDDLFLVLERIEGPTLADTIFEYARVGRFVGSATVVTWGLELVCTLEAIHGAGFIYRDLKATNVIVGVDGSLRVIDFELADVPGAPACGGTRGYASPQQFDLAGASAADDIYALGALLYFAATGADPVLVPNDFRLLDRPIRALNPDVPPALERVIARCLQHDPAARWSTLDELRQALAAARPAGSPPGAKHARVLSSAGASSRRSIHGVRRLGDSLCAALEAMSNGRRPTLSTIGLAGDIGHGDITHGREGIVLALADIVGAIGESSHHATLEQAAQSLCEARPQGQPLAGLYVGEAGRGAALLRVGQVLGEERFVAAAVERGRLVARLPYDCPDLSSGAAGRLRFHLLLWDQVHEVDQLEAAVKAGEFLLEQAEGNQDECWWSLPPGVSEQERPVYVGYSHGAAGVGDALLDLFDVTGDVRYRATARAAGQWIERQGLPALTDGTGLTWPGKPGAHAAVPAWCHGSTGIARFFVHAARAAVMPTAGQVAERAARTVARGAPWMGPCQCHGLAGNIELLLDMAQATGDRRYVDEALALEPLLHAFAKEVAGRLVWTSDKPPAVSPGYMLGYAGVAMCLLRLADPWRRPTQLSLSGFRHATPAPADAGAAQRITIRLGRDPRSGA